MDDRVKTKFDKSLLKNDKIILTIAMPGDTIYSERNGKYRPVRWLMKEKTDYTASLKAKKKILTLGTKYLLDFMFYAGIVVTITLPYSIRKIGELLPYMVEHYEETVVIYFVLGIAALVLVRELRRIFGTVLAEDCFVQENVISLQKMGNWSFFIAVMSVVRSIVYMTVAMAVVILVFVIAGLFSKVLAYVFEEAVRYKEENDLTI